MVIQLSEITLYKFEDMNSQYPLLDIPFLSFEDKQILIEGVSGSGKSTFLQMLAGLRSVSTGSISINDSCITKFTPREMDEFRGKNIGFVFQSPHFIKHFTVEQNLQLAFAYTPANKDLIHGLLNTIGLFSQMKQKVGSLSFGEAQRLSIARAVIHKPAVILADEPSSALDDKNCEIIFDLLCNLANIHGEQYQPQLILASHDSRLKDKIKIHYKIENGRFVS